MRHYAPEPEEDPNINKRIHNVALHKLVLLLIFLAGVAGMVGHPKL